LGRNVSKYHDSLCSAEPVLACCEPDVWTAVDTSAVKFCGRAFE